MFDELDSINDILSESKKPTEQKASKFRPKAHFKPAKAVVRVEQEVSGHPPSLAIESADVEVDHGVTKEPVGQPRTMDSSAVIHEQRGVGEDADVLCSADILDDLIAPTSTAASTAGKFKPKPKIQPQSRKLAKPSAAVPGDVVSCVSTMDSGGSSLESITYELNEAKRPHHHNEEMTIASVLSQDGPQVLNSGTNSQLDATNSEAEISQARSMESLESNSHGISGSHEELIDQLKFSHDGAQPSESEANLPGLSDHRPEEQGSMMLPHIESLVDFSFQPTATGDKSVRKFQPKKKKESKGKSVSFVLPDTSENAAPVEPPSITCNSKEILFSMERTRTDQQLEDTSKSSPTMVDLNDDFSLRSGEEQREAHHIGVEELKQHHKEETLEDGTVLDDGAIKASRKLRKRTRMMKAGMPGGRADDELDTVDFISQMDEQGDGSDDEYMGEEDKRKRAPKQSKKKNSERKEPSMRNRRATKKSDSPMEGSSKKKLSHTLRRNRRKVDKVLLETPDNEIDRRQISIRNLILLAEAKERILNKEAASGNCSSSHSNSSFLQRNVDDFDIFEDEFGEDHENEETNHSIRPSSKKLNYHSYMNRPQSGRWSKSETELLYQAIRQFGSDFGMIQQLFPNRTRHQIKLKFKNEERRHPLQVHDALIHRSKDHSHFETVIQQLQIQAKQNSRRQEEINQENEDAVGDFSDNEEQEANEGKHEAQSPAEVDDLDRLSDWEIEDMEKDEYDPW